MAPAARARGDGDGDGGDGGVVSLGLEVDLQCFGRPVGKKEN